MLGVIIGVGSVITLMSVGRGAEASITSTLEGLGTNLIYGGIFVAYGVYRLN